MQFPGLHSRFFLSFIALFYPLLRLASLAIEREGLWTLRYRLALYEPYAKTALFFAIVASLGRILDVTLSGEPTRPLFLCLYAIFCSISGFLFIRSAKRSRQYFQLRFLAWAGPSRTGIPAALAANIASEEHWNRLYERFRPFTTESREIRWASRARDGLFVDPTDLLKAAAEGLGYTESNLFRSSMVGVYHPQKLGQPVSLLWGEHLGFARRCSRAIISVPRRYLSSNPKTSHGFSAKAICVAYGILGRNKGPAPSALVCNLAKNGRMREFEESSVWWPRPSKTLRGYYVAEFREAFSLLGEMYVCAAAELALLLADADEAAAEDWLRGRMEHQDLQLNHVAKRMGAPDGDLDRLYRGHYAAMLVSLSSHKIGQRCRPELLVFERMCKKEGVPTPEWTVQPEMMDRREREYQGAGGDIVALIEAVV